MKTKSLLLLTLISVALFSCKDKDDDDEIVKPAASLTVMAGYWGNSFEFTPFVNQKTIAADSIGAYEQLVLSFLEKNITLPDDLDSDSLKFQFEVKTNSDIEIFKYRENISSSTTSFFTFGSRSELSGEFGLPYQFNTVAVPGNDTIEIKNLGDSIRVNYKSHYSAQKSNKVFTILP